MAKRLNILFVIFFSLVLIFSCTAPLVALAWYDPEFTVWRWDSEISPAPWTGSLSESYNFELYFTSGSDVLFNDIYNENAIGERPTLWYDDGIGPTYVIESGRLTRSFYQYMFFGSAVDYFPDSFYSWLFANAILTDKDGSELPILTYHIGDFIAEFTDGSSTPSVTLEVFDYGVRFTFGSRSKFWNVPSGFGTFTGLSYTDDNTPDLLVGNTYTLSDIQSLSYNVWFYPCDASAPPTDPPDPPTDPSDPPSTGVFTSSIQVYDRTGAILRYEFTVSSDAYAPDLVINFGDLGFEIVEHGVPASSFDLAGSGLITDNFLGFSTTKGASVPSFGSGASISLGGYPMNETLKLYLVYDSFFADPSDADFTTWIISAVSGFFDFALWPGLSLGNLVLTVISIGLLYAFLKLTV